MCGPPWRKEEAVARPTSAFGRGALGGCVPGPTTRAPSRSSKRSPTANGAGHRAPNSSDPVPVSGTAFVVGRRTARPDQAADTSTAGARVYSGALSEFVGHGLLLRTDEGCRLRERAAQ